MGSASCKTSRTPAPDQKKQDNKNITIGVFGLDDAGKTSAVKVLEGAPTDRVQPTIGSSSTTVSHTASNKGEQRIKIVDVSGSRKFRPTWSQFYEQIHGLIFVIDASEKDRWRENHETLEYLLEHDQLKNKPILILANKQDQKGALNNENELKRKLDPVRLKGKYQIEFCTALPPNQKTKVDESIRKGFSWLIRTIDENYTDINARVTKARTPRMNTKHNRNDSDDNEHDQRYSNGISTDYRSKLTSQKLPSINTNRNKIKTSSDDDDDDDDLRNGRHLSNDLSKKRKLLGVTNNNSTPIKKSNDNEPKAFRSTYETFPEETPWTTPGPPTLKQTKSDDMLSRLLTKPPLPSDSRKRTVSPLVRDLKPYTNGSSSLKHDKNSDEEGSYNRQQPSKTTSRFDSSSLPTTRFASTVKKPTSTTYHDDDDDDDYHNNRRTTTTVKKPYDQHDDDDDDDEFENDYLKRSSSMRTTKTSDYNENKTYPRTSDRLNTEYRGTLTKPATRSTYDHDTNNHSSYGRKDTSSKVNYEDEDDDDYSPSKPVTRSTYNPRTKLEEDHHQHWSSSKPTVHSRFNKTDDDDDDYPSSSSKPTTHSKFEDDDYPSSSSKAIARSKYEDDDDDDEYDKNYSNSSKKNNYPSSSYNNSSRPRYGTNDFYT